MSESNSQTDGACGNPECWNFAGPNVGPLIADCGQLLDYAADQGIDVKPPVAKDIADARAAYARGKWNPEHEEKLYAAKMLLASAIQPVTLYTLSAATIHKAKKMTRFYFWWTIALVTIIVPVSMLAFVDAGLSNKGKDLIEQNDRIAQDLHDELQNHRIAFMKGGGRLLAASAETASPASGASAKVVKASSTHAASDVVDASDTDTTWTKSDPALSYSVTPEALTIKRNLQEFARNTRQLYEETQWLSKLTLHGYVNSYQSPWMVSGTTRRTNLELTIPLLDPLDSDSLKIAMDTDRNKLAASEYPVSDGMVKLAVYQDIRAMAQDTQRASDIAWGAATSYLLPVLYAVLGTLAFILRELAAQTSKRTFYPTYSRFANRTRLITAIIVGAVIGLFGSLWSSHLAAVSPLAIAFLAGYGADTFFSFLDKAAASRERVATT